MNTLLTLGAAILTLIGAGIAWRACYVESSQAKALTPWAAGFGAVGAGLALVVFFVGIRLTAISDATIESLGRKVEPRHLSSDQKALLVSKVRLCGWTKAEVIWHGVGESEVYAKDLASVFEQAGVPTAIHTLGPFVPSAWGLLVVKTTNDDSTRLTAILDEAGIASQIALTNSTLGEKDHPTLLVGTREDVGIPLGTAPTKPR